MATAAVSTITDHFKSSLSVLSYDNINDLTNDQIRNIIKNIERNIYKNKAENKRLQRQYEQTQNRLNENHQKMQDNSKRPYLVGNIVEIIDDKSVVLKTSTRQTIFLPIPGFIDIKQLNVNDLVGVNTDSFIILDKVPTDFDVRVKAMVIDKKPKETFADIGGLDEEIKQLTESIVLPFEQQYKFKNIGITSSKGVLLYGPPGTGKTSLARACANRLNATFIKLCGTQLSTRYKGEGAEIIRELFDLAKEKSPSIIFIDEIDAIGMKRNYKNKTNETLIQLLNELDGFSNDEQIKVIAATNRVDVLDPALIRSGRIDRKIKCGLPNESERVKVLKVHANKIKYDKSNVDFIQIARCTDDFNGAQLKAVVVEAGMIALRKGSYDLKHEDFMEAVGVVKGKKKSNLNYFV